MAKSTNNRPQGDPTVLPSWVKPQLCKLVDAPPQGPEWLHEIKYDGYRVYARLDRGRAHLLTRTGLIPVAGRRWSAPVAAFVQAVRRYSWTSVIGAKLAKGRPPLLDPVV